MTPRRIGLIAALAGPCLLALLSETSRPAQAVPPAQTKPPAVALLVTPPRGDASELVVVDGASAPVRLGSVAHLVDASVHGALLPSGQAVVVADDAPRSDRSWASALFLVEGGKPGVRIASDVAHAARPVVTEDGKVIVERGAAGPQETSGGKLRMRVDDISVDAIDPATGAATPLYTGSGYTAHVAGVLGGEVLVYRVGPQGADLVAIDRASRALRVVVPSWPALARDFSVDATNGALVVQQTRVATATAPQTNVLERIDVKTGARTELAQGVGRDLVPFALPSGAVLYTPAGSDRVAVAGASAPAPTPALPPASFFWASHATSAFVAGLVVQGGELPAPVVVDAKTGAVHAVPAPPDRRVEVVGIVGGAP